MKYKIKRQSVVVAGRETVLLDGRIVLGGEAYDESLAKLVSKE